MSDPFLTLEASIQSSSPREFYQIVQSSAVTYYVASGTRDIVYNGNTYVASPTARTEIGISSITNEAQLTIALPLSHPLSQRYPAQGSPPRVITVTIYRQQPGGFVEQVAVGKITSMGIEKHLAKFLIESLIARLSRRQLPTVSASRSCQHVLFDNNCRAVRNLFTLGVTGGIIPTLTVLSFDGRTVVISSIGGQADHWAQGGELVHLPTGERMTILEQVGTTITMQTPIPDLTTGDAVSVSAGCAHDILTCRIKFSNQINFGGFPQLPTKNPFTPTGLGVIEQG